jgi:NAD(P)-dependent dehydrogenase (short-subunit alcohol dehydrogenase family)
MFSLSGKTALITGSGSGIGQEIALCFARAGAKVYVMDKDTEGGARTVARVKANGGLAAMIEGNVTDAASCKQAVETVLTANDGRCDILVNNAGIGHVGTVLGTTEADLDRLYNVNVKGVMFMNQAALPSMIARKAGVIVNLASIAGIVAIRDRFAYCATKFAVVGMTKCLALDHAADGIRVNCICPGRVETEFVQGLLRQYPDPEKAYAEMCATQLFNRMGKPEEIAAAALYLASDEAAFVTGSSLIIDAGWSIGK